MVPLLAFWMDYSLALLFPRTTQAPEDLPYWLTENEFPPKSKMSIAPELVSPADSECFPQVLLVRPESRLPVR